MSSIEETSGTELSGGTGIMGKERDTKKDIKKKPAKTKKEKRQEKRKKRESID